MLSAGKHAVDPLNGLHGIRRVERGDHEVAGFGGHERGFDRLEVAHFADDDHVGVLPQHVAQGALERADVAEHFFLNDDAAAIFVGELDGILDRDDLGAAIFVDRVDHEVERGRFAHAGRAGDENQAARQAGQFLDDGRQAEFLGRTNHGFAQPNRKLGTAGVQIDADAEAADARKVPRKARLPFAFE